ncbi:MAG: hypothetical protein HY934_06265 [Candidatus Firestonebacteria bacterium]|nr:hypothetical protein [Candidatus Firestonebacteria bacterium]
MKAKRIILNSLFLLFCFTLVISALEVKKTMKVNYDNKSSYILSNIIGASVNTGKVLFTVSSDNADILDIMVAIENTDKVWKFNKVELKQKDSKYESEIFSVVWNGMDKENKALIEGEYNIKIMAVNTQDETIEDNTHSFNIDNLIPEIRSVTLNPKTDNTIKIEAQIFDNSEINKVTFHIKGMEKDEFLLNQDIVHNGLYFGSVSTGILKDNFEGVILATDKALNISICKITPNINYEIKVESESNIISFNASILPYQFNIKGTYSIGTLKTNVNDNYENTIDLNGTNWIKKIEIRNLSGNRTSIPILDENGGWEINNIKDFLNNGENRIQFVITDLFSNLITKDSPIVINYDIELPRIDKAYKWAGSQIILEMSEKVKIIPNQTLFEVDLIKPSGEKSTFAASGRLTNNDSNIELLIEGDFLSKIVKGDKIITRAIKISDIAGNISEKIESPEFIFE